MSTSIEQRIVEMKFDNAGFAKGVESTLNDLDKLDKATKFDGGKNNLKQLQVAADQVNFQKILAGIDSINCSLNHMQSFGFQVFQNLSRHAVDWATGMVKSMSVDQIAGGFKEYELKMDSIKTIMNSTGEELDVVKDKLNELNEYSDKTIYSFSDMTSSIGKFTNSGVKLDAAVSAIQGISNQAALAGANANDASRAMYNFAQALSSGSVKLIDWRSIENANMATVDFKQSLIDTAVALGTVVETEEGYKSTTTDAQGKVSDLFTSTIGFNDALSSQWMTTEVLTQALQNYATDTREMTEEERNAWIEKMHGLKYTDEQIERFEKLGQRAFDAAQEVTTYSKMMDALKESVGSGWAQTFEILFGDLHEATNLWTGINNVISGIIGKIADTRNGILELWKEDGGHTALMEAFKNLFEAIENITTYVGLAFETLFGHRYLQQFDRVRKFFADRKSFSGNIVIIKKMSEMLVSVSKRFSEISAKIANGFNPNVERSRNRLGQIYEVVQTILVPARALFTIITGIGKKALPLVAKIATLVSSVLLKSVSLIGSFFTVGGFQGKIYNFANNIVKVVGGVLDRISRVIDVIWSAIDKHFLSINFDPIIAKTKSLSGVFEHFFNVVITSFPNAYKAVKNFLDSFAKFNGFKSIGGLFSSLSTTIRDKFTWAVKESVKWIKNLRINFKRFKTTIQPIVNFVSDKLVSAFTSISTFWNENEIVETYRKKVSDFISEISGFDKAGVKVEHLGDRFVVLGNWIDSAKTKVHDFFAAFKENAVIKFVTNFATTSFSTIYESVKAFGALLSKALQEFFENENVQSVFSSISEAFNRFIENLKGLDTTDAGSILNGIVTSVNDLATALNNIRIDVLERLTTKIDNIYKKLFPDSIDVDTKSVGIFEAVKRFVTSGLLGIFAGIKEFPWGRIWTIIKSLLGMFLLGAIVKFVRSLNKTVTVWGIIIRNISTILSSFAGAIRAAKWEILAQALFKAALAVVAIAAALTVLSLIPEDMLSKATAALGTILFLLAMFMLVFYKVKGLSAAANEGNSDANKLFETGANIVETIKDFADVMAKSLSKLLKKLGLAVLIVAFGFAVGLLAKTIMDLAKIDITQVVEGLIKIVLIGAVITAFVVAMEHIPTGADKFGGILQVAALVYVLGLTIEKLTKVMNSLKNVKEFLSGFKRLIALIAVIVVAMGALAAVSRFAGPAVAGLLAIAGAMVIMAFALTLLLPALTALAMFKPEQLLTAVIAILMLAIGIAALTKIAAAMQAAAVGLASLFIIIGVIIGLSVGLLIFAAALKTLVDIAPELEKHWKIIAAFLIGFVVAAGLVIAISTFFAEALAVVGLALQTIGLAVMFFGLGLLATSAAIYLFAGAIEACIASITGNEEAAINAVSTLIYAICKGIIDGAGYILVAIVAGLDDVTIGLREHGPSFVANFVALFLELLIAIIKGIAMAIERGVVWLSDYTAERIPIFWAKVKAVSTDLINSFFASILEFAARWIGKIPTAGAQELARGMRNEAGLLRLEAAVVADETMREAEERVRQNTDKGLLPAVKDAALASTKEFDQTLDEAPPSGEEFMKRTELDIANRIPFVHQKADEAGNAIVDGVDKRDELAMSTDGMYGMVSNFLGSSKLEIGSTNLGFEDLFNQWPSATFENGEMSMEEMQKWLDQEGMAIEGQDWSDESYLAYLSYADGAQNAESEIVRTSEDISDASVDGLKKGDSKGAGTEQVTWFGTGMASSKSSATLAAGGVAQSAVDTFGAQQYKQGAYDAGMNYDLGLADGINDYIAPVVNAAVNVMNQTLAATKAAANEASPSKATYEIGYYLDAGLANGISENGEIIVGASENTMYLALQSIRASMAQIADEINNSDIDFDPIITPVVDSDEAIRKLRRLNDILSGGTSVTMRAALRNASYDRQSGTIGNNTVTNNSNVSYVQNITSPRALRSRDIYRQTKNLIAIQKGARA